MFGDVAIQVLPYSRRTPPFSKSNHTYVELFMPQFEDYLLSWGKAEWFLAHHSISTIPHKHFGKITMFNISIQFLSMDEAQGSCHWVNRHSHPLGSIEPLFG